MSYGRVGVLGLGLMGGSVGAALRARGLADSVIGFTPNRAELERALELGLIDEAAESAEVLVSAADLVVWAAPLAALTSSLPSFADAARGKLVTDVTSLKTPVQSLMREHGLADRFVGAHPLCGGTGSGPDAADGDRFTGARVFLCSGDADEGDRRTVEEFWRALGGETVWIPVEEHDRCMIDVSHLPQLVSNALAEVLREEGWSVDDLGPGGLDTTRLAGSSPAMWLSLFEASSVDLSLKLRAVSAVLEMLAGAIDDGRMDHIQALMERTADWRSGS